MTDAELRTLAEKATRGQWQVVETKHPWHLPEKPVMGIPAFEGETFPERSGEHTERRIFTVWNDPQTKSPYPIVTGSIGIGVVQGTPIHMTEISADNAAFIAAASPPAILGLLTRITTLEAENERLREEARLAWSSDEHQAVWHDLRHRAETAEAEVAGLRAALHRLVNTYADMQDGDGEPCPDVSFAKAALSEKDQRNDQ